MIDVSCNWGGVGGSDLWSWFYVANTERDGGNTDGNYKTFSVCHLVTYLNNLCLVIKYQVCHQFDRSMRVNIKWSGQKAQILNDNKDIRDARHSAFKTIANLQNRQNILKFAVQTTHVILNNANSRNMIWFEQNIWCVCDCSKFRSRKIYQINTLYPSV